MQIQISLIPAPNSDTERKDYTILWSDVAFIPFRFGDYIEVPGIVGQYKIDKLVWVAPKNPESESWSYVVMAYMI